MIENKYEVIELEELVLDEVELEEVVLDEIEYY